MKQAIDRLIEKINKMQNPTVIGLDPRTEMIPECIKNKYEDTFEGISKAIIEYNKKIIDEVYDIIPAVKPQIAFYEMYGIPGMEAFKITCDYAKEKGIIVIVDAKRGDIGTTAAGYSNAFLGKTKLKQVEEFVFDGDDTINPFLEDCKKYNKGIFVLVKTSNKSSGDLQDLELKNGKKVYEEVAELVKRWGEDSIGENGYSDVAVVVGATYPEQLEEIRKIIPNAYFLIPGYGAQGGKAKDIALAFENGMGGIVNASRSLMCAYKSELWKDKFKEEEFAKATRAEAIRMKNELCEAINK